MAEQTSTETKFTVARKGAAITGLRPNVAAATSDLHSIEQSMRAAFLEPDVELATVTVTTTVSDPQPYVEQPAAATEPAADVTEGQAEQGADEKPTDGKKTTGK